MTTMTRSRMYTTKIDIPESTRTELIDVLNKSLAITLDMWTQVKQAHWNVKGKDFYQLHLLFDEIAGDLPEPIDTLAERITTLGGVAHGTTRMAASTTTLPEYPLDAVGGDDHLSALIERYSVFCKHLRQAQDKTAELGDMDSNDIYIEISRKADMRLWFLEAHLQGGSNSNHRNK
jgi:starvation-inducible DNA-binding protein